MIVLVTLCHVLLTIRSPEVLGKTVRVFLTSQYVVIVILFTFVDIMLSLSAKELRTGLRASADQLLLLPLIKREAG